MFKYIHILLLIGPRCNWNTARVGVKHQSINHITNKIITFTHSSIFLSALVWAWSLAFLAIEAYKENSTIKSPKKKAGKL
jgi:hypothetical protein